MQNRAAIRAANHIFTIPSASKSRGYAKTGDLADEPKTPFDEHALQRLMLASDMAIVLYQEQRLKWAHTQTGVDDEVAYTGPCARLRPWMKTAASTVFF
jgi:hypothetical protein